MASCCAVLCINVYCKIISAPNAHWASSSGASAPLLLSTKGLWEPNTSQVCSSKQRACKILAACMLGCRLLGAPAEENNSFLKTHKNFCSGEFLCFSALYEYSFWSWHDEGSLISSRLNQKQKQYYHINCLFTFFLDKWHLLTDRSIAAEQSSQDEYAWWHRAPWMPSKVEKANGCRSSSVLENSISFPCPMPEYKKRLTPCHRNYWSFHIHFNSRRGSLWRLVSMRWWEISLLKLQECQSIWHFAISASFIPICS